MVAVPKLEKSYFPFSFLLRSASYQGKGALIAENCKLHDGRVQKTQTQLVWTTVDGVAAILHGFNYKKNDGTHQKIVAFADNAYYTIRTVDSDKTLSTPTLPEANEAAITGTLTFTNGSADVSAVGGAFTSELSVGDLIYLDAEYAHRTTIESITDNDNLVLSVVYPGAGGAGNGKRSSPHFTSDLFSSRQIGQYFFIGNDSATLALCRWDGTTLEPSTNAPDEIKFLTRDKNRLVAGEPRQTGFSEEDFATSNNWTGGAGAKVHGVYKTELVVPTAGIEAGSGIVIAGEIGSDAQKVIPNNASDDIANDTSIDGFTSLERGVDSANQICAAAGFVFKLNPDGIHQMNPFTGESVNLTNTGEIGRKWKNYDTSAGVIAYDIGNKQVVACVKLGARNDTLIIVDVSDEDRPISTVPDAFYSSLFVSGNDLYGGSSSNGTIYKVFGTLRAEFHYSQEWDGLDSPQTEKKLKTISIFANVNPLSEFTAKLYTDGSATPFWERTLTTSDATSITSSTAYEGYVFELGKAELFTQGQDYIKDTKARVKFSTIRFEITNDDPYFFELLDVVIRYKSKQKLTSEKTMKRV